MPADTQAVNKPYWWDNLQEEQFWMEITDRQDIGADLKCPQLDEGGARQPSYRRNFLSTTRPPELLQRCSVSLPGRHPDNCIVCPHVTIRGKTPLPLAS
jgi:hypothetical protein